MTGRITDEDAIEKAAQRAAEGLFRITMAAKLSGASDHDLVLAVHQFWSELADSETFSPDAFESVFNRASVLCAEKVGEAVGRVVTPENPSQH